MAHRFWVLPLVQDFPAPLDRTDLTIGLLPVRQPREGLWVTLEVLQLGRSLGRWQLKNFGASRTIDVRLPLPGADPTSPATLRVRTNSELRLAY